MQYLGALSVDELDELPDLVNDKMASKPLLDAMLALSAPGLEKAKESFRQSLEAVLADEASGNLAKQGSDLGLPAAVQQKLALEVSTSQSPPLPSATCSPKGLPSRIEPTPGLHRTLSLAFHPELTRIPASTLSVFPLYLAT